MYKASTRIHKSINKIQARGDYVEEEKVIFESVRLLKIWLHSNKSLYYKEKFLHEGESLERAITILSRGLTGNVLNAGDLLEAIKNMEYVSVCYNIQNFILEIKSFPEMKQNVLDAKS